MEWSPACLFHRSPSEHFAIIILNQPQNWLAYTRLVNLASLIVCADGGANRLRKHTAQDSRVRMPDAIIGDLDSLESETEHYYRNKGVQIIRDADQYSTDFTKCLKWLRENSGKKTGQDRLDIIALGGLGGRVDQGFSQIHHLYMATRDGSLLRGEIYLLSEQSLSFVLEKGKNRIGLDREIFAENVGIIPVTGPAVLSTKGLEWDVQDWKTEFGTQLSTSNHIRSGTIEIDASERVLFTIELGPGLSMSEGA